MDKIEQFKKELNEMVEKELPYEDILKKSQELDKYITKAFKEMNNVKC